MVVLSAFVISDGHFSSTSALFPSLLSSPSTAGRVSRLIQLWDVQQSRAGTGKSRWFPRAGNEPVPFGSEGEHAGSFSYVRRVLRPPALSPAAPEGQLTDARGGDALAAAGAGGDEAAAELRWRFPTER